jgi:hypothetical protein
LASLRTCRRSPKMNGTRGILHSARRPVVSSMAIAAASGSAASPCRKTVSSPASSVAGMNGPSAHSQPPLKTRGLFVHAESAEPSASILSTPWCLQDDPAGRHIRLYIASPSWDEIFQGRWRKREREAAAKCQPRMPERRT